VRRVGLVLALAALSPTLAASRPNERQILARPFPMEAAPSFPGGLFHWVDSLAGTSGGKTVPAYRRDYVQRFGPIGDDDAVHLRAFAALRAQRPTSYLLGVFCSARGIDDALTSVKAELPPGAWDDLAAALAHFRTKYEVIWNDGEIPRSFLERARRDPSRKRLEALLSKIVRFYRVDPLTAPPPRLALVPVPSGFGTHAEAIGRVLLIEIRREDALADEASVIVHETSHFLWGLVPPDRQRRLAEHASSLGPAAPRIFALLGEAVPTALGQGVADRMFDPRRWSIDGPWYHTPEVDGCAKKIYPLVQEALDSGGALDEAFLDRVFRAVASP